jgi:hypothetical protein
MLHLFCTKGRWATFWAIFSQAHPVTLQTVHFREFVTSTD